MICPARRSHSCIRIGEIVRHPSFSSAQPAGGKSRVILRHPRPALCLSVLSGMSARQVFVLASVHEEEGHRSLDYVTTADSMHAMHERLRGTTHRLPHTVPWLGSSLHALAAANQMTPAQVCGEGRSRCQSVTVVLWLKFTRGHNAHAASLLPVCMQGDSLMPSSQQHVDPVASQASIPN
ncbi:hypothetical protein BKA81DRAFT_51506 [Phyllosticta paracitricarpa]